MKTVIVFSFSRLTVPILQITLWATKPRKISYFMVQENCAVKWLKSNLLYTNVLVNECIYSSVLNTHTHAYCSPPGWADIMWVSLSHFQSPISPVNVIHIPHIQKETSLQRIASLSVAHNGCIWKFGFEKIEHFSVRMITANIAV